MLDYNGGIRSLWETRGRECLEGKEGVEAFRTPDHLAAWQVLGLSKI